MKRQHILFMYVALTSLLAWVFLLPIAEGYKWLIVLGEGMMLASAFIYVSCQHTMLRAIWRVATPSPSTPRPGRRSGH